VVAGVLARRSDSAIESAMGPPTPGGVFSTGATTIPGMSPNCSNGLGAPPFTSGLKGFGNGPQAPIKSADTKITGNKRLKKNTTHQQAQKQEGE
jgi:hypothetical protein